jgi:hypothetical protein
MVPSGAYEQGRSYRKGCRGAVSPDQLAAFRRWFHEFDAVVWDRQLEEDVRAGKLDALADEALQAYKSGKCTEL